ncbi:porin family protein [Seonamhaeicola marinus]|uniref:PorT family protein n=1 Tax=Seonamhaeicola marinus TaxID=1912246 RepID=A0A5D0HKV0_9FLAO|nr:porin family protein [Seonamhaeicola marinus]TYA72003.1 PorT family protein [Seonamhaeicola marinus]
MKKILLFTLLLVLSFGAFSQEESKTIPVDTLKQKKEGFVFKGVKWGVRGGYNISNLDFEDGSSANIPNKHRNSVYIGFFANIGLSRTISLNPELQFSAEGANDERLHLDFIQAPVLLRFRLSEKIHVAAGPQAGLKVHKYEDGMKNITYSAVGGVEYKITHVLFAEARYTYGISNVFDEDTGISARNTNIQLGIGYKF